MHTKKRLILSLTLSITAVLFVACIAGQGYNFYLLHHLQARTPGIETWYNPLREEFFIQLLLCIAVWISAYFISSHNLKYRTPGIILSVLSTVTFCGLLLQGICMNEYYEEFYLGGYNADFEWIFSHTFLVINLLFCVFGLVFVLMGFRNVRSASAKDSQTSEYLFEVTQYIGMISGLIGMIFTYYAFQYLNYYSHKLTPDYVNWIYMCCLIFIFPYLSMIIFWIVKLAFKKNKSFYDEKQERDLASAGLFTWLLSIPLMSLFLFINLGHVRLASGILAFPAYTFTTLFIFSASVLFYYKRV